MAEGPRCRAQASSLGELSLYTLYKRPRPPAELQAPATCQPTLGKAVCSRALPVLQSCRKYCPLNLSVWGQLVAPMRVHSVMSNSLQFRAVAHLKLHGQLCVLKFMDRLLCPWNFSRQNAGLGCHSFSEDLLDPGIKPMCRALADKFFTSEPLGKSQVICYVAINTRNPGHGDSGKEDLAGLCG